MESSLDQATRKTTSVTAILMLLFKYHLFSCCLLMLEKHAMLSLPGGIQVNGCWMLMEYKFLVIFLNIFLRIRLPVHRLLISIMNQNSHSSANDMKFTLLRKCYNPKLTLLRKCYEPKITHLHIIKWLIFSVATSYTRPYKHLIFCLWCQYNMR